MTAAGVTWQGVCLTGLRSCCSLYLASAFVADWLKIARDYSTVGNSYALLHDAVTAAAAHTVPNEQSLGKVSLPSLAVEGQSTLVTPGKQINVVQCHVVCHTESENCLPSRWCSRLEGKSYHGMHLLLCRTSLWGSKRNFVVKHVQCFQSFSRHDNALAHEAWSLRVLLYWAHWKRACIMWYKCSVWWGLILLCLAFFRAPRCWDGNTVTA